MTSPSFASPAATSPQPASTWQYVYGVINSEDQLLFEVNGIGEAAEVYTIGADGLAVVTSNISYPSFGALGRAEIIGHLTAHQRVLEAVQQDVPVLPIKFGTILPDKARLMALLRCGGDVLSQALKLYASKQQIEVVVLWDLSQVFALIAADEQIVSLKSRIATMSAEESNAARILVGQLVHTAMQQRRSKLSQELIAQLRDLSDDLIINPLMNDAMVANVALLISAERRDELDERLDAFDTRHGGQLQIRCVGPLPPYSFATLEVQAPPFEAVDMARQMLELDEETSYASLKRSFRSLAARHHPDHNQHDEGAAAYMDSLTQAYRLLAAIAQAQAAGSLADDPPCHFSRAAIEDTVLLAIARQEEAPPEGSQEL